MKIAVASEGKMVTEHLGHCEGFAIFETEDNQIKIKSSGKMSIGKLEKDL